MIYTCIDIDVILVLRLSNEGLRWSQYTPGWNIKKKPPY